MLHSFMVPGCHVKGLRCESRSLVVLSARRRRDDARCPDCSCPSNTIHGYYGRHPADLPLCGRRVRLDLRLRRYVCINPGCRRQTFAERLPMLLAPRSRRTRRLAQAQAQIGVALGGEAGSCLAHRLCMPTSGDTLLRLIRATPVAAAGTPAIIGVDDWAVRKRTRYGTIIVDLEYRRPIDCCLIAIPKRWPPGCRPGRGSASSHGTAGPSIGARSPQVRRQRSRSLIDGTCSVTRGRWPSDGRRARMRGCKGSRLS